MVAPTPGYRWLGEDEILQRGDEYYRGDDWCPVLFVDKPAKRGLGSFSYRRPIRTEGPQSQTQFLPRPAAVSLESDTLRTILAKEAEHVAVIEQNNRGRDRAVELGVELRVLRDNFAARFRDRLFIVGERVVDTADGKYGARGAEVVA